MSVHHQSLVGIHNHKGYKLYVIHNRLHLYILLCLPILYVSILDKIQNSVKYYVTPNTLKIYCRVQWKNDILIMLNQPHLKDKMKMSESRVLRRLFQHTWGEVKGGWWKLHNGEVYTSSSSCDNIIGTKWWILGSWDMYCVREIRIVTNLWGTTERTGHRRKNNIDMDVRVGVCRCGLNRSGIG